jgi:hypothetical protein
MENPEGEQKMKKLILFMVIALLISPAMAAVSRQIQFVDEYGLPAANLTYAAVYNGGTSTTSTIYKERSLTNAITIPMTPSSTNTTLTAYNSMISFWSRSAKTYDVEAMVGGTMVKAYGLNEGDTRITVPAVARQGATRKKGSFDRFLTQPLCAAKIGAGAATGTGGDENLMYTGTNVFEYHIVGTATVVAPTRIATGLTIGLDVADNDGIEICPGILAGNQSAFTVGTDGAFHLKIRFDIADVSGSDNVMVGFRKAEAYQAVALDNYDEMAAFDVVSGDIKTATILNAAATTSTDTTDNWADDATKTLEVYVSQAGVVTFKINGAAPTVTQAFTFDDAEVVVPFFYNRYATTTPGVIYIEEWDCGLD